MCTRVVTFLGLALLAGAVGCGQTPPTESVRFLEGTEIDLGTVPGTARRQFTLVNDTDRAIEVAQVSTDCGCAAAMVESGTRVVPPRGRCLLDFTLVVGAGQRRTTALTVVTKDGNFANINISATGRVSRWRGVDERVDAGRIWVGDKGECVVRVASTEPLLASEDPPHGQWEFGDSSRVTLGASQMKRRPDGVWECSCVVQVAATHVGRFSATVACSVEGAVVKTPVTWTVVSPLGLESHRILVPRTTPVSIPVSVPTGLAIVGVACAEAAPGVDCAFDAEAGVLSKPVLTIHLRQDGRSVEQPGILDLTVILSEAAGGRRFESPLSVLFTAKREQVDK